MQKFPTILTFSLISLFLIKPASGASSESFENKIERLRADLRSESMLSTDFPKSNCHFLELVDRDDGYATAGARIYLERSLRQISKTVSPQMPDAGGISQQLGHLTLKKVLPASKASVLARFAAIANQAAHGEQFESPALRRMLIEDMPKILSFLEQLLLKVRV